MRHIVTALVVAAFVVPTVGAADDEKYVSKEGKYAIQFPADAKVETGKQKANRVDVFFARVVGKDSVYAAMYSDLTDDDKNTPAKKILDEAVGGMLERSNGKAKKLKDIEFGPDKHPGREVLMEYDGNTMKARIILVGMRVYVAVVTGPKDFATTKDATKFLDSFEITK
jgi:hypothetical protein